ncbi:MAG TPA: response regulator, partial [Cyanobacteria bacterium UBA8530]|nr:response regulator [Cyanobacteria bacterium UBA8530]
MRILIVEDDFTSRRLLQKILAPYGECEIAINGKEAVSAVELAWGEDAPYHLICLDIMMPEM